MTIAHNTRYTLAVNSDNSYDTRYQTGNKPVAGPLIGVNATAYAALIGSLQNRSTGSAINLNMRSVLTGAAVDIAAAVFSLITISGNDAAAGGWAFSDPDTLNNPGTTANVGGVWEVIATDTNGNAVVLPQTVWSFITVVGTDTMAPTIPTGFALTPLPLALQGTLDSSSDNYDGSTPPGGVHHYNIYAGATKLTPPSPITAPAANKSPQLIVTPIGNASPAGSAVQNKQQWTLSAAGIGWHGVTADELEFASAQLSGDQSVAIKVDNWTSPASFSTAGLMVRESIAPNSVFATIYLHANGNGLRVDTRTTTSGTSYNIAQLLATPGPAWVRIDRAGTSLTFLYSLDGENWKVLTTLTLAMAAVCQWGLALSAQSAGVTATAVFHEVNFATKPTVNFQIATTVALTLAATAVDAAGNESAASLAVTGTPATATGTLTPFSQAQLRNFGHYVQYNNYDSATISTASHQWGMMSATLAADVADPNIRGMLWNYKWSQHEASKRNYTAGDSTLTDLFAFIAQAEAAAGRPANSFKVILLGTMCHLTKGLGGSSRWPSGWIVGTLGGTIPSGAMIIDTPNDPSQQAQISFNAASITEMQAHHQHFAGLHIDGRPLDGHPRLAAIGLDDETSLLAGQGVFPAVPEVPLLTCYQNLLSAFPNTAVLVRVNWFSSDSAGTTLLDGLFNHPLGWHCWFGGPDPMQRQTTMQRMWRGEVSGGIGDQRAKRIWCSENQGAGWGEVGQRGNDYWLTPPGAIAAGEFGQNAYDRIPGLIVSPNTWWAGLTAPTPTYRNNYENTAWVPSNIPKPAAGTQTNPATFQADMHGYVYIWNRDDSGPPGNFVNQFSTRRFQCPQRTNSDGSITFSPYTHGFSTNGVQCAKDVIDGMQGTTNTDIPSTLQ